MISFQHSMTLSLLIFNTLTDAKLLVQSCPDQMETRESTFRGRINEVHATRLEPSNKFHNDSAFQADYSGNFHCTRPRRVEVLRDCSFKLFVSD